MSERLLTEAELMDIQSGATVLTGNTIDLLIADHRRMREAIASVDGGQYCPFCQQDSLEHADNCIFIEVTNGK